jgi:hypothetical protein
MTTPIMEENPTTTAPPLCCAEPDEHRAPFTSYWYWSPGGRHCWQCDGRIDAGWQYCRYMPERAHPPRPRGSFPSRS